MTLRDLVPEQKCNVESPGALSPMEDRPTIWFIASASCLFTALIITQSLRQGKLSLPMSYDDIVYFNDAAHRLQILYSNGLGPCFASFFRDPPHAPLATLVAFVGFALFGMNDWAPAAVDVVWVALLLLFIRLLLPEVHRSIYVIVAISALAWPLTGYLVVECRPDIYTALLTVMGSVLMFQAPFLRASMRHVATVAGLFGAAILAKPSISPVTLFLYCASIAINIIVEGRPLFDRKVLQKAALRVLSYFGITAAIVLPYFAFAWRDIYTYIYTVTLGSQKDLWGVPMSARDAAAYYFWGPGGQFMMGRWFWIAISLVAIDTLLGLITHRSIDPRKIGLYVIFLLAYAAVSIPSVKHRFIGVIVPTFILAFYVMACGSIAGSLVRWGRYGQWGVVGLAALLLLITGAAFDWPQAAANTRFTASRRHQIIHELGDYFESHADDYAREMITFPVISEYLNHDVLMFELLKRRLDWHKITAIGSQFTQQEQLAAIGAADHVILFDENDPDILRRLPSVQFYGQIRPLVVANPSFEKKLELSTADDVHKIRVYTRKLSFSDAPFGGLNVVSGFLPIEGPYPQWNLPLVRWATGSFARAQFDTTKSGAWWLMMRVSTYLPGQSIEVILDSEPAGTCELPKIN